MALTDLVQVGTGSWVDPKDVLRIYTCKGTDFKTGEPYVHTYLTCASLHGSMFGDGPSAHTISSDWSVEAVEAALGLTSITVLGEVTE